MSAVRLGTRASLLAMTQSRWVAERLSAALGRQVELVEVTTTGDRDSAPLAQLGGTGVFVSALREALLDGRIDVAVHSLKDLPTQPADGIALAAVPQREDPRDAVVARPGAPHSSTPSASVWRSPTSGAMWTPGSARSVRARTTPSCSPAQDWPGSAVSRRPPRCSTPYRCSPPPGRARSRSR